MAQDRKPVQTATGLNAQVPDVPQNLGERTVHGGLLAIASQSLGMVIQLGTMVVLTRSLSPSDFGLIAMAGVITGFLAMFTELGLSAATVQRKTIDQNIVSGFFYLNLAMGMVVGLAMMALAPLAAMLFSEPRLQTIIIVLAFTVPVLAASSQHSALLQRAMRWKMIFGITVTVQAIASAAAIFCALELGIGYWALVVQSLMSAGATTVALWIGSGWRPGRVENWSALKEPLNFGLHLTFFSFLNYFHRQADDALIGWRWGDVLLGHYNRAYALLLIPLRLLNQPVSSALIPALSRLQNEPQRWRNTYLDALTPITAVSAFLGANLMAASLPLVRILYGPQWDLAGETLGYLAISMIPAGAMNTVGWIYISLGRTAKMSRWSIITSPVWIGCFLIGLPYGATGVAIAYSAAVLAICIPCLAYAAKSSPVKLGEMLAMTMPAIVAGLTSGAVSKTQMVDYLYPNPWAALIQSAAIASGIFFISMAVYCMVDRNYRQRLTLRILIHAKNFWKAKAST